MLRDQASLLDMLEAIKRVELITTRNTFTSFVADDTLRWTVYSQIVIVGEAASRLSTELQVQHQDIPWKDIIGMRHRLVHGYDDIDWKRVWDTAAKDLPLLKERLVVLTRAVE